MAINVNDDLHIFTSSNCEVNKDAIFLWIKRYTSTHFRSNWSVWTKKRTARRTTDWTYESPHLHHWLNFQTLFTLTFLFHKNCVILLVFFILLWADKYTCNQLRLLVQMEERISFIRKAKKGLHGPHITPTVGSAIANWQCAFPHECPLWWMVYNP